MLRYLCARRVFERIMVRSGFKTALLALILGLIVLRLASLPFCRLLLIHTLWFLHTINSISQIFIFIFGFWLISHRRSLMVSLGFFQFFYNRFSSFKVWFIAPWSLHFDRQSCLRARRHSFIKICWVRDKITSGSVVFECAIGMSMNMRFINQVGKRICFLKQFAFEMFKVRTMLGFVIGSVHHLTFHIN